MADTYLITGAGRGIGLALAMDLSTRGHRILASLRDPSRQTEVVEHAAQLLQLDAASAESISGLAEQVGDTPLDVLINNAGVSSSARSLASLDAADLQRVMMVNAIAPLLIAKALMPNLRRGRRKIIVNISSQLGSIGNNSGGSSFAYRASKAALNMFTVSLANELSEHGFTCVAVHPGWVRTEMGGPQAPLTPRQSARSLADLIDRLSPADSGTFLNHDGRPITW